MKVENFKLPLGKKTLRSYELILTENCNMRCKYCFDDTYSDRSSCNYNYKMELSMIPDILDFIDKTRDESLNFVDIIFFGGEPLLNWEFIIKFIEAAKIMSFECHYSLNTNLTLLNKEKIDFICKNHIGTSISIDGIKKANDKTRNYNGGESAWHDMVKNIPYFVAKARFNGSGLTAMMVINQDNYTYIEEDYEFLIELGIPFVNILWSYESNFSKDQLDYLENKLKRMFIEKRLPYFLDMNRKFLRHYPNDEDIPSCYNANTAVTISPKGKLFFCHRLMPKMIESNKNSIGNIYKGFERYNLELVNNRIGGLESCRECEAFNICHGGCIGCVVNNTGSYGVYEPMCNVYKMIWRLIKCIRRRS